MVNENGHSNGLRLQSGWFTLGTPFKYEVDIDKHYKWTLLTPRSRNWKVCDLLNLQGSWQFKEYKNEGYKGLS